jgi:hypothetical protein
MWFATCVCMAYGLRMDFMPLSGWKKSKQSQYMMTNDNVIMNVHK